MRKISTLIMLTCWALAALAVAYLLFGKQETDGVILEVSPQPVQNLTLKDAQSIGVTSTLEGARYAGQTQSGTRWEITAATANTKGQGEQTVATLADLSAIIQQNTNQPLTFHADHGTYTTETEQLSLIKNVHVTGYGVTLQSETLDSNFSTETVTSQTPTTLTGTFGSWHVQLSGEALNATFAAPNQTITIGGSTQTVFTPQQTGGNL